MVYNFPTVTAGLDLPSDLIAELAVHPNIVGTKLSCGNVGKLHRLTAAFPSTSFAVFPGASAVFAPSLLCGGAGIIGALVNLLPKCHVELHELWKAGKVEAAMALQAQIAHADWEVSKGGGVSALKSLVNEVFGYGNARARGPLGLVDVGKDVMGKDQVFQALVELEKKL